MVQGKSRWYGMALAAAVVLFALGAQACLAAEEGGGPAAVTVEKNTAIVIGVVIVVGVCCTASAYAVARVGAAAFGAASERPELLMRSIIFVALAEGIAIYGLIVGIMLLMRLK